MVILSDKLGTGYEAMVHHFYSNTRELKSNRDIRLFWVEFGTGFFDSQLSCLEWRKYSRYHQNNLLLFGQTRTRWCNLASRKLTRSPVTIDRPDTFLFETFAIDGIRIGDNNITEATALPPVPIMTANGIKVKQMPAVQNMGPDCSRQKFGSKRQDLDNGSSSSGSI